MLSGMSNTEQMEDNLSFMDNFVPVSSEEKETINKAYEIMSKIPQVPCTDCRYCVKGCPKNIPINEIFSLLNFQDKFNNEGLAKHLYSNAVNKENVGKADDCIACKKCESVCPQHIKIVDNLARAAKVLG